MSRYDKYDPVSGGFRAQLNAAISTNLGVVQGVTINGSGKVVIGGTVANIVGVIVADKTFAANQPIDVMTDGEIVELPTGAPYTAGSFLYASSTGAITNVATDKYIGQVIELGRAVIRVRGGAI